MHIFLGVATTDHYKTFFREDTSQRKLQMFCFLLKQCNTTTSFLVSHRPKHYQYNENNITYIMIRVPQESQDQEVPSQKLSQSWQQQDQGQNKQPRFGGTWLTIGYPMVPWIPCKATSKLLHEATQSSSFLKSTILHRCILHC